MISGREDGVVVRLFPKIEVDKTEGVKKILIELAKQLIATFPEVWILASTGFGIVAVDIEAILYLALDLVTKIGFGLYVSTNHTLKN